MHSSRRHRFAVLSLSAGLAFALAACGGNKDLDELPPAQGYGTAETGGPGSPGYVDPTYGGPGGYDPNAPGAGASYGGTTGPSGATGSQADFMASVPSDRVFFDTDRYNVDSADMATLQAQAQWLMRFPGTMAVIEGHADERGTRDYNLALGERRANAVRAYLMSLGVPANRLRTVSYGKERPQALGSNENAWAQNRRAVTVTVQ